MSLEKSLETNGQRAKRYGREFKALRRKIKDARKAIGDAEKAYDRAEKNMRRLERILEDKDKQSVQAANDYDAARRERREKERDVNSAKNEEKRLQARARYLYNWLVKHGARPTHRV